MSTSPRPISVDHSVPVGHSTPASHLVAVEPLGSEPFDATRAARLQLLSDAAVGVAPLMLARDRLLPVAEGLAPLLSDRPGADAAGTGTQAGLQRGSTVALHGPGGAASLAFGLVAEAVREGAWVAVIGGGGWLGFGAIEELGVPLQRMVHIDLRHSATGSSPDAAVVSAVVDGFDVVVWMQPGRVSAPLSRRLVARVRERSSVLVRVGGAPWPESADRRFDVHASQWSGLGIGHGHLRERQVTVVASARRNGRPRRHQVMLPDGDGVARVIEPVRRDQAPALPGDDSRYAGADVDALVTTLPTPVDQAG